MYIHTPEAVGFISLRLDVYLPPQFLHCNGRFYHFRLCLSFLLEELPLVRRLRSIPITELPCYYSPVRLPLIFSSFPSSVIELVLLRAFLPGMRRVSPVA